MKILLINPPRFRNIPVIREERCEIIERNSVLPPYSLLQIGGLLKAHDTELIDANGHDLDYEYIEKRLKKKDYDILIFRFTPTTFDHDLRTAGISKKINKKALTIGICFTLKTLAKDILKNADLDVFVTGEYETVVSDIVQNHDNLKNVNGIAYKKGKRIIINKQGKTLERYDITPDYRLIDSLDRYYINTNDSKKTTIIYTSKGCPYKCAYCTVAGTALRIRNAESVLAELEYLKKRFNLQKVSFFDETFTINRKRVIKLCNGLRKLKIEWYCNTRSNLVDFRLLKIMKKSGCSGLSLGIESGSQTILDNVSKGVTVSENEKAISYAKKAGIKVYCSFIFGLPGENKKTINKTISFIRKTLPTSAQFNVAVPYPGTKLYKLAKRKKWVKNPDWRLLYQDKSLISIAGLTNRESDNARKSAYKALYFNPKWIMQNLIFVLKNPSDFFIAFKYVIKIINNYFRYGMQHAH